MRRFIFLSGAMNQSVPRSLYRFPRSLARTAHAFTIIEVMVAMMILSVGIIGVAGMQLAAHRSNQQSAYATVAVQLAQEMAERIRANRVVTDGADSANPYLIDTAAPLPDLGKRCYGPVQCTPAEMAGLDVHEWTSKVTGKTGGNGTTYQGLPAGRGIVCRDAKVWEPGKGYTWTCDGGNTGSGAPMVVKIGWAAKNSDGSLTERNAEAVEDRPEVVLLVRP